MYICELLPAYRDYLTHERRLARSTVTAYISDLNVFSQYATKPVQAIVLDDLRGYMRHLSKSGLETATIRRKMHGFTTFWEWLQLCRYVSEIVPKGLRLPRRGKKAYKWLSHEELVRFISTPCTYGSERQRQRDSLAWKTLGYLGLRRSEMLNLRVGDVKIDEKRIILRDTKSGDDREVALPAPLFEAFNAYLATLPPNPDRRVFALGRRTWSLNGFTAAFRAHLKACGLDGKGYTPHSLRHTFGTLLAKRRVPKPVIQEAMGHKYGGTTDGYMHASPEWVAEAIADFAVSLEEFGVQN